MGRGRRAREQVGRQGEGQEWEKEGRGRRKIMKVKEGQEAVIPYVN